MTRPRRGSSPARRRRRQRRPATAMASRPRALHRAPAATLEMTTWVAGRPEARALGPTGRSAGTHVARRWARRSAWEWWPGSQSATPRGTVRPSPAALARATGLAWVSWSVPASRSAPAWTRATVTASPAASTSAAASTSSAASPSVASCRWERALDWAIWTAAAPSRQPASAWASAWATPSPPAARARSLRRAKRPAEPPGAPRSSRRARPGRAGPSAKA